MMKIAVLLSGGVDSSVALFRLLEEGQKEVTAYYLKVWLEDEWKYEGGCPWEEDLEVAREVCRMASVPLKILPLQREYHNEVIAYAVEELRRGATPSPDLICNRKIKFHAALKRIPEGVEKIATGHYGIIKEVENSFHLFQSPDPVKDQSYFLSRLSQKQLGRLLFPVGSLMKKSVRAMAKHYRLPNQERKDSQGLCFLGKIRYRDFVKHYLGERVGEIQEKESGRRLGEHRGYWFYTMGQRRGLDLGGGPWYVTGKDRERNIVYISSRERTEENALDSFVLRDLHWIGEPSLEGQITLKLRHGPHKISAKMVAIEDGALHVEMDTSDQGVATGQFAVLYRGERCLGSGRIVRSDEEGVPGRE